MSHSEFSARRATIEDLDALRTLWSQAGYPAEALEKRVTEFQVAVDENDRPVACLGLKIQGRHGLMHGEAIGLKDQENALRELLWRRVEALANNHGLLKIWTQHSADFYSDKNFKRAAEKETDALPESLGDKTAAWNVLLLKEENPDMVSVDHEFEMFQHASRSETERIVSQARTFKWLALAIGIVGLILGIILSIIFFLKAMDR